MIQNNPFYMLYTLYPEILLYSSIALLIVFLAIHKFRRTTDNSNSASIDFLPEIVLKNISKEGEISWEIQINNIDKHSVKLLSVEVRGSCLLLDNSKFIIFSKDNLAENNCSIDSNEMIKIPFIHSIDPEFKPRNIKLGCSFKLQDYKGNVEKFYMPLLFSKAVLFSQVNEVAKVEKKMIQQREVKQG